MNESENEETRSDREPETRVTGEPEQPVGENFDWQGSEDLTSLSEALLRDSLVTLVEEERVLSYRRRVLQGRIDLIRAELVRRGGVSLSPEELVQVLLGNNPALQVQPDERPQDTGDEDAGSEERGR